MADNHRQEDIFELTEEMASEPATAQDKNIVASTISEVQSQVEKRSSAAPEPVSPFQTLVDPDAPEPEEDPPSIQPPPEEQQRPSFVPKPIPEPVSVAPIQNVTGKTTSVPPVNFEKAKQNGAPSKSSGSGPKPYSTLSSEETPKAPASDNIDVVESPTSDNMGSEPPVPPIPASAPVDEEMSSEEVEQQTMEIAFDEMPAVPPPVSSPPAPPIPASTSIFEDKSRKEGQVPPPPPVSSPPAPPIPALTSIFEDQSRKEGQAPPPPPVSTPPAPPIPHDVNTKTVTQETDVAASSIEEAIAAAPTQLPSSTSDSTEDVVDLSEEVDLMKTDEISDRIASSVTGAMEADDQSVDDHAEVEEDSVNIDSVPIESEDEQFVDFNAPETSTDSSPDQKSAQKVKGKAPDEDDAEEIDLSEAEEMPQTGPPPAPPSSAAAGEGRKPKIRRRQKPSKEWWAKIFNDDYVSTIPKATVRGDQRKVNFIEKSLAVGQNALVLDLACGNGRHAVGMAKRGYRLVGIDLSLPMLAQAAELAQDERQNINFIHGDMRDLSFDKTFDAIFCMGTSFGYFSEEGNLRVLQGVFRALKPGGTFLMEVANRDHVITQTPDLTWFEGNGSICMEESQFEFSTSRLHVTRQLIMDGGRQVQNDISIRLYSLHELKELFTQTGFVIGKISGHTATPGAFFGPDSVRIFISAQRPL